MRLEYIPLIAGIAVVAILGVVHLIGMQECEERGLTPVIGVWNTVKCVRTE